MSFTSFTGSEQEAALSTPVLLGPVDSLMIDQIFWCRKSVNQQNNIYVQYRIHLIYTVKTKQEKISNRKKSINILLQPSSIQLTQCTPCASLKCSLSLFSVPYLCLQWKQANGLPLASELAWHTSIWVTRMDRRLNVFRHMSQLKL